MVKRPATTTLPRDDNRRLCAGSNVSEPLGPMRTPPTAASTSSNTGRSIATVSFEPGTLPPQVAGSLQRTAVGEPAGGCVVSTGAVVSGGW
jgi:hypothetical protein